MFLVVLQCFQVYSVIFMSTSLFWVYSTRVDRDTPTGEMLPVLPICVCVGVCGGRDVHVCVYVCVCVCVLCVVWVWVCVCLVGLIYTISTRSPTQC